MDTVIEKKKGIKKKHLPYIIVGAMLFVSLLWLIFGNHASRMNVDGQRVTVSSVSQGQFNDYVRIPGQVMPISTIQLSAIEGGMVEEKVVEEGAIVKKGDVIVRLTSNNLSLEILSSEADLAEKQNHLRNTQVDMERVRLDLRKERLLAEKELQQKKRTAEQYGRLYDENLISREERTKAQEDFVFARENLTLILDRQIQDSIYRNNQVKIMEDDLASMRRNFELVNQRVGNLNVKSPIDGQLGLLDVEIGQNIPTGLRIGQISDLSDYKVEASIDEHYIDRVRAGLDATFERQDRNFALRVRKVYPEVREKVFRTEFVFEGERPENIRAGQTYYINLQLGQPTEAVMIPRGPFYQTTGGKWIFVVSENGSKAVRRNITIGRQNPNFYEVTSGLEPGEKVITSSYDNYGDTQELILK